MEAGLHALAADQLGPESGAALVLRRAVHREHVGMAHARELARLVQPEARRRIARALQRGHARRDGVEAAELQRDLAFEARVPGAPHLAEAALADRLQGTEEPPTEGGLAQ